MRLSGEAWELVFQRDGHVFPEPFQRFGELVEVFHDHGCQRLLDLGCGTGRHVIGLASKGFQVCGLDYSPTGLRLARDWLGKESAGASLVLGDARRPLPFRDSAFDGLLSTQVIHHGLLSTVRKTIAELRRVLRLGGLLFVTVPAQLADGLQYEEIEPGTYVPTSGVEAGVPHHIFSPQRLQGELAGFRALDLSIRESVVLAFLGVKERDKET
jgi:SAM-dependent methyltransferase